MVTGAYHPEISSGGEQCRHIAQQLRGRAEVQVLTTSVDPSLSRYDTIDGIKVTRIRVDVRSEISKLRAFRRMAIDLFNLVRNNDIVHLHGYSTKNVLVTMIAKMFRKPIVMSLHTAGYDEPAAIERQGSLALWAFLSADLYLERQPRPGRHVSFGRDAGGADPAGPERHRHRSIRAHVCAMSAGRCAPRSDCRSICQ